MQNWTHIGSSKHKAHKQVNLTRTLLERETNSRSSLLVNCLFRVFNKASGAVSSFSFSISLCNLTRCCWAETITLLPIKFPKDSSIKARASLKVLPFWGVRVSLTALDFSSASVTLGPCHVTTHHSLSSCEGAIHHKTSKISLPC